MGGVKGNISCHAMSTDRCHICLTLASPNVDFWGMQDRSDTRRPRTKVLRAEESDNSGLRRGDRRRSGEERGAGGPQAEMPPAAGAGVAGGGARMQSFWRSGTEGLGKDGGDGSVVKNSPRRREAWKPTAWGSFDSTILYTSESTRLESSVSLASIHGWMPSAWSGARLVVGIHRSRGSDSEAGPVPSISTADQSLWSRGAGWILQSLLEACES
ncbi:unnamed protein product [Rangifer tarandus platyrhynchus]|uniref:Uncharacterized protein n=2 Tax=Rangifer tarandus platyrhynchus TaxID=3082113 RepID=A0ACB0F613_RANTA|nr:unnamed protein product [Rangifer tarandus platyrhynchus]CAI9708283.1 unnamed protein product [Rangifer tarandus platyrhynchus]